jgi:hypothetical protein
VLKVLETPYDTAIRDLTVSGQSIRVEPAPENAELILTDRSAGR